MVVHIYIDSILSALATPFASNVADEKVTDNDISDNECDADEVEDILSHIPVYSNKAEENVNTVNAIQDSFSGANASLEALIDIEDESISTGPYQEPHHHVEAVRALPENNGEEGKYHIHPLLTVNLKLMRASLRRRERRLMISLTSEWGKDWHLPYGVYGLFLSSYLSFSSYIWLYIYSLDRTHLRYSHL